MTDPRWKHGEELQQRLELGVDYGNVIGYFVRLSVIKDDGGTEWVSLTADEADSLANQLRESAVQARERAKFEENH